MFDYFVVRRLYCTRRSYVYNKIFFCSVSFKFHSDLISPVVYVFYFGYFIHRYLSVLFSLVFPGSEISLILVFGILVVFGIQNYRLLQNAFFLQLLQIESRAGHLWLGIHFGALYCSLYNFVLSVSLSVSFRIFEGVFFCVVFLWFHSLSLILFCPVWCFSFILLYEFCCICSTTFSTSKSLSQQCLPEVSVGHWCNYYW